MKFGQHVRAFRISRSMTQQQLADRVGVSISYICKIENHRLHFGDYPSEKFIHKLATELEANEDELLLLADKVPPAIRKRIQQRPDFFRLVAGLDDQAMDKLAAQLRTRNRIK